MRAQTRKLYLSILRKKITLPKNWETILINFLVTHVVGRIRIWKWYERNLNPMKWTHTLRLSMSWDSRNIMEVLKSLLPTRIHYLWSKKTNNACESLLIELSQSMRRFILYITASNFFFYHMKKSVKRYL